MLFNLMQINWWSSCRTSVPLSHNRIQLHIKVENDLHFIVREQRRVLSFIERALPMIYTLAWICFHPFAALMILLRYLCRFLLPGNPLPENIECKPARSFASWTLESGELYLTTDTSLKHYASISTQGHNHEFDIRQAQKNGNNRTWNRCTICPRLSQPRSQCFPIGITEDIRTAICRYNVPFKRISSTS